MKPKDDPTRCPLCGQENACGIAAGRSTCWCFEVTIPKEALEALPAGSEAEACLCAACAAKAMAKKEEPRS